MDFKVFDGFVFSSQVKRLAFEFFSGDLHSTIDAVRAASFSLPCQSRTSWHGACGVGVPFKFSRCDACQRQSFVEVSSQTFPSREDFRFALCYDSNFAVTAGFTETARGSYCLACCGQNHAEQFRGAFQCEACGDSETLAPDLEAHSVFELFPLVPLLILLLLPPI